MATLERFKIESKIKRNRTFSNELKRSIVKDLEHGIVTVAEIKHRYEVSGTSIYNWIYKYSSYSKRGEKVVVEKKSEARKNLELKNKIHELERLLGQKQIEIEFMKKMIELAETEHGIDFKKKLGGKQSHGSGVTGINTVTK